MRLALSALGGGSFREKLLAKDFTRAKISPTDASRLGTWADVNEALVSNRLEPPRIRLFQDGTPVESDRFMRPRVNRRAVSYGEIDFAAIEGLLRAGASLAIDSIDEIVPSIREAARELERFVAEGVQVNAYVTWGEISGFGPHWDDHDTLIVQLEGTKNWKVFGAGRDSPMFQDFELDHKQPEAIVWEGDLAAGDVLHVPRGWWHEVTGRGQGSLHLTFGFTRQTVLDAIMSMVEGLRRNALFRRDIDKFDRAVLRQQEAEVKDALRSAADQLDLQAAVDEHEAELRPRAAVSLPWSVDPKQLHLRRPRNLTLVARPPLRLEYAGSEVAFSATMRRFRLHASFGPLLEILSSEGILSYERAQHLSNFTPSDFEKAVKVLVENRIIMVD